MTLPKRALEAYDHWRFGPVLGVSDEGAAARTIAESAYMSAKARAYPGAGPMCVGLIIDGERMGSAGEVPIGPDEYADVVSASTDRTFATTNVGVRVNTRIYQPLPEHHVAEAKGDEDAWLDAVFARFAPFLDTPDGMPRPLTVRLRVDGGDDSLEALRRLVPKIEAGRAEGKLGGADLHRLSFLVVYDALIGEAEVEQILALIALAGELDVPEVAVDGEKVEAARRRISIQGLLNILDADTCRRVLKAGHAVGVQPTYHYEVDAETAARTVWTGLDSAKHQGLTAAKYGLFPLMLKQQRHVVESIERWLRSDWTPIPAFYVDTPLVTDDDVLESDRIVEAARMWMDMVVAAGAKVVLVDAPDRINPHRLLKRTDDPNDPGVLTIDQVATLQAHADCIRLRVLWSGGNSAEHAYELGKLGVFGIFTTGSASRVAAVSGALVGDQQLARQAQPTELGVRRIHALLQAGYLCHVLDDAATVAEIDARAGDLIAAGNDGDDCVEALDAIDAVMIRGWRAHWG